MTVYGNDDGNREREFSENDCGGGQTMQTIKYDQLAQGVQGVQGRSENQ